MKTINYEFDVSKDLADKLGLTPGSALLYTAITVTNQAFVTTFAGVIDFWVNKMVASYPVPIMGGIINQAIPAPDNINNSFWELLNQDPTSLYNSLNRSNGNANLGRINFGVDNISYFIVCTYVTGVGGTAPVPDTTNYYIVFLTI